MVDFLKFLNIYMSLDIYGKKCRMLSYLFIYTNSINFGLAVDIVLVGVSYFYKQTLFRNQLMIKIYLNGKVGILTNIFV